MTEYSRTTRAAANLIIPLIKVDRLLSLGVRDQIRSEISRLIAEGALEQGAQLPSCRAMAQGLSVAVNSVLGAYLKLIDEGILSSKPKSGYFVSLELSASPLQGSAKTKTRETTNIVDRITKGKLPSKGSYIVRPPDWPKYKYPFVCNQIPVNRFPLAQWRECMRLAMNSRDVASWAGDNQYWDSDEFLQEVCTRILPRRGVAARPENVLVTLGAQQAIYIISSLLRGYGRVVAMEDPGYPDARNIFEQIFDEIRFIPVDDEGIIVDERLAECDLVYVTPNRQFPTTIAMSARRREMLLKMAESADFLIIEDDYDGDTDFSEEVEAPLYSGNRNGRVIYINSLSKSVAPGLRLGFLVAQEDLVSEARALRGLMIRHTPLLLQKTAGLFLKFGYHDALCKRLHAIFEQRIAIASGIIDDLFPQFDIRNEDGSTIFVMTDKAGRDAQMIKEKALQANIVIEPLWPCYSDDKKGKSSFRIGLSAIPSDQIEPGLTLLSETVGTV